MPPRKKPIARTEPHETPEPVPPIAEPPGAGATAREPSREPSTEAQPTAAQSPTEATPPAPPPEDEVPRRQWQPDPFPFMSIGLGAENDSPRMTLFRSNKLNQMAIRFDEKADEEHRRQLRDAGWRWREAEGVWTKQLDRERRSASHLEAERLFTTIGDAIRAERGLSGRTGAGE